MRGRLEAPRIGVQYVSLSFLSYSADIQVCMVFATVQCSRQVLMRLTLVGTNALRHNARSGSQCQTGLYAALLLRGLVLPILFPCMFEAQQILMFGSQPRM